MKNFLLTFSIFLLAFNGINAQDVLAEYSSAGTTGTGTVSTDAAVTATGFDRGSGISAVSGASTFNSSGWTTGSSAATNDYVEYTISAAAGKIVSLTNFDIRYDRSNTGPSSMEIQASIDGFATAGEVIYSDGSVNASGEQASAQSLTSFSNLQMFESPTTVTFRLFAWNAGGGGGTFDIEDLAGTTDIGIIIRGESMNALPVTLTSFEAKPTNEKSVSLTWQTASEENNDYFSIEHSTDGTSFREIATQAGNGTTTIVQDYSFLHKEVENGLHYYRLKQVDFDEKYEYTNIVTAKVSHSNDDIFLTPNPTSNVILIQTKTPFERDANFQILNMQGQVVLTSVLQEGTSNMELNISDFPVGIYYLQLFVNNDVMMKKIIKQ